MKNLKESEVGTSEIFYFELASKLKAAYRAKAKNQDDMYAEVSVHCYCGGPFEMNITCSGLDDMPNEVAFYVTYLAEDDFSFDVGFGMNNLKTTISDYYKANGDLAEMSPKIAIAPSALRFLDEIAAGQGMLFEKKLNEAREARYAAQAAKFAKDTKFLQDAAKTAKVVIDEIEGYSRPDDWSVILDTEDDYKANAFRNAVGDLLEGTENAYGASYDDIPGMRSIHLGCIQYYEWSEMNGGDVYDDLDESIREKYVVFACPKKKWIDYRCRTDW